jgi:hypothetical protein
MSGPPPTYEQVCQVIGQLVLEHRLQLDHARRQHEQDQAHLGELGRRLAELENVRRLEGK